jgi:thymidylate synthase
MQAWKDIISKALQYGEPRADRTGVGTYSLFGEALEFDLAQGFPAVTTKKLFFPSVASELTCFLNGCSTLAEFHAVGCNIWDANVNAEYWQKVNPREPGYAGRIYGVQWRDWQSVDSNGEPKTTDQLKNLVANLIKDPFSRRHVVTCFNPGELDQMCLPPCHLFFQAYISITKEKTKVLHFTVYMRSVDLFIGLPFDIASYALLQHLMCRSISSYSNEVTPGKLVFFLGDAHLYANHVEQARVLLTRKPFEPPTLELLEGAHLFNFMPYKAQLINYQHHDTIKAPMNV